MKKIFSLLLVIVCILLMFTSCSSKKSDIYITPDGAEYMVVRDENGNIIINGNDKLKVYSLNENKKRQKSDTGEYITEFIEFDSQIVIENTVETAEMRFDLPKTFVADNDNPGYFYSEDKNAEIFISYYDGSFGNIEDHINGCQVNCEKLLESYGSEAFSYEKYSVVVSETECVAFRTKCTSSEYYKHAYTFIFPYDSGCYYINCIIDTSNASKVDFNKFIEKIILK